MRDHPSGQARVPDPGGLHPAKAGAAPPVRPERVHDLRGRRVRRRTECVLWQLRVSRRRRGRPLLGTPEPRLRRRAPSCRNRAAEFEYRQPPEGPDPDPGRRRRRHGLRDPPGRGPTDQGCPRDARRGPRLAEAQLPQHPPGSRTGGEQPAPSRSCNPSRRWPRGGSTTSTRSCPTTGPSSGSSGQSARHREPSGRGGIA